MSFGKAITEPVLLLTLAAVVVSVALFVRETDRRRRILLAILLATQILLLLLSIPAVSWSLDRLVVLRGEREPAPDWIVVAGGGYAFAEGEPRSLSGESISRVLMAVEWWKTNPTAIMVMSGSAGDRSPGGTRPLSDQMRLLATAHGVPPGQVLEEPISLRTSEHPVGLRDVVGVPTNVPVGIVTSPWHLRRTSREFRRYYDRVIPVPVESSPPELRALRAWTPSAQALFHSTTLIHELIGIVWSELRFRIRGEPQLRRTTEGQFTSL
jgi:uncharacterized SAM-binding protein YcdF (DUF218 family)